MASTMRTGVLRRLTRNEGGTRTSVLRASQRNNLGIRFQSGMSLPDKFQGKRTTLDVKMPELEEPELSVQIAPENVVCDSITHLGHVSNLLAFRPRPVPFRENLCANRCQQSGTNTGRGSSNAKGGHCGCRFLFRASFFQCVPKHRCS
ncbi:hypothetical protein FRC16_005924 [Serendipita sp. 398]|nr:hypothetical protein FRC16_005924 [Serendipita sp. 398]